MSDRLTHAALDTLERRAADALRAVYPIGGFPPWGDREDARAALALAAEVRCLRAAAGELAECRARLRQTDLRLATLRQAWGGAAPPQDVEVYDGESAP